MVNINEAEASAETRTCSYILGSVLQNSEFFRMFTLPSLFKNKQTTQKKAKPRKNPQKTKQKSYKKLEYCENSIKIGMA